jgi:hypothetical protein
MSVERGVSLRPQSSFSIMRQDNWISFMPPSNEGSVVKTCNDNGPGKIVGILLINSIGTNNETEQSIQNHNALGRRVFAFIQFGER